MQAATLWRLRNDLVLLPTSHHARASALLKSWVAGCCIGCFLIQAMVYWIVKCLSWISSYNTWFISRLLVGGCFHSTKSTFQNPGQSESINIIWRSYTYKNSFMLELTDAISLYLAQILVSPLAPEKRLIFFVCSTTVIFVKFVYQPFCLHRYL